MMRRQTLELAFATLLFAGLWPSPTAPEVQPDPQPIVEPDKCEPVEPEPLPEPRKHAIIEFYTATTFHCPPCERFKAMIPDLERMGWTVDEKPGVGRVPYFHVWLKNEKYAKRSGFTSRANFNSYLRGLNSRASGAEVSGQGATGSGDALRTSTGSGLVRIQPSRPYTPRWTWPGNLRTHLQGYPHYIDTTGMTQDDLERTHDALHDAGRMTTRRTTRTVRRG